MNSTVRNLLALLGAVGLAVDTACYAYEPTITGAPSPGAEVRVQLNSEGTIELARWLGPRVISVDGKLSSVTSGGSMMLAPTAVQTMDGSRRALLFEEVVTVPTEYQSSVQMRTLDKRKTTIAAVALAASLVVTGIIVMRGAGSGTPPGGGPGDGVFNRRGVR